MASCVWAHISHNKLWALSILRWVWRRVVTDSILTVLTGSRAYGLETKDSDFDYHGVFVTPTRELLSIGSKPKQTRTWSESVEQDSVAWEVGHFLNLAIHCNPTVLETFVAPVEYATPYGYQLRVLFESVLTRKRVYDAFLGYSHNQQKKMFNKPGNPVEAQPSERAWKFAVQYLRVLLQGERLLRTGKLVLNIAAYGEHVREHLMDIKQGEYTMGHVVDQADRYKKRLELAYTDSKVREEPGLKAVNDFLIEVRKETW